MKHQIKTLADIAALLNKLTPEQLLQPGKIIPFDGPLCDITLLAEEENDYLCNKTNPDDIGYEANLMRAHGKNFNRNNYEILIPKGRFVFFASIK